LIQHLLQHPLGLMHVLTALAAIIFGAVVIFSRKGTVRHKLMGRWYIAAMWALNLSALLDYELFGRFGPFHWMSLVSLATVIGGHWVVLKKAPGWKQPHAYMMAGSYVGLMAATFAEIATRIPGWSFASAAIISSVVIIAAGTWMMKRLIPAVLNPGRGRSRRNQ